MPLVPHSLPAGAPQSSNALRVRSGADSGVRRTTSLPSVTLVTACGWACRSAAPSSIQPIFNLENGTSSASAWFTLNVTSDNTKLYLSTAAGTAFIDLGAPPAVGVPFWWWIIANGTGTSVVNAGYVLLNGVSVSATNSTYSHSSFTTALLSIGHDSWATERYQGDLWNVKVWDRALVQSDLMRERMSYEPQSTRSLHLWWPLGDVADARDLSGNTRHGTRQGNLACYPRRVNLIQRQALIYVGQGASIIQTTGASAGTSTAAATGQAIAAAAGASAGAASVTVVGAAVAAGAGAAAGSSSAAAAGGALAAGAGSAAGTSTAVATGQATAAAAGASAGAASAEATGAAIAAGTGTAAGTSTAQAYSSSEITLEGTGSAAGAATASATGQALAAGAGTADGVASVIAIGAALHEAAGAAAGSSSASAAGAAIAAAAGEAAGGASVETTGAAIAAGTGTAAGTSTAQAYSSSEITLEGTGSAAGAATASATGQALAAGAGAADGAASVIAIGAAIAAGTGVAAGSSSASATAEAATGPVAADLDTDFYRRAARAAMAMRTHGQGDHVMVAIGQRRRMH